MTKPPPPSHKDIARMGRPPDRVTYLRWLAATQELCAVIKTRAGKTPNRLIEKALNIGKRDSLTNEFTGRYFSRFLNASGGRDPKAMTPDRLSQVAELAAKRGWLRREDLPSWHFGRSGTGGLGSSLAKLIVPDGELFSEQLSEIQRERLALLRAAQNAGDAVRALIAARKACKFAELVDATPVVDWIDGEEVQVFRENVIELHSVLAMLDASAVVVQHELGDLIPTLPKQPKRKTMASPSATDPAGTHPAQSARPKKAKPVAKRPKNGAVLIGKSE